MEMITLYVSPSELHYLLDKDSIIIKDTVKNDCDSCLEPIEYEVCLRIEE